MARERIVSLQILRFVAAMMVAASHLPVFVVASTWRAPSMAFQAPLRIGFAGVDIFFVLSGFVIALTGPLADPRPSGFLFYWRRWRRVVPIYFVLSAPVIVGAAMAGNLNAPQSAATFLFWPAFGRDFIEPYLNPGWSLCFEMVFYTVVALILAGGALRRNLIIAATVVVILILARVALGLESLRFLTSPLFIEFGAGVALCAMRRWIGKLGATAGAAVLFAGFCLLAADVWTFDGNMFLGLTEWTSDLRRVFLCGLPAIIIVAGAIAAEPLCRGKLSGAIATGGDASYSIYLTHFYSMSLLADIWWALKAPQELWGLSAAGLCAAALGGLLVYRLVERPVLGDLKRLSFRRAQAMAVAASPD